MEPTTINATMRRRGRPGTSRRVVALVFLCLLLGAVMTVAVAWGVALKGGEFTHNPFPPHGEAWDPRTGQVWSILHRNRLGADFLVAKPHLDTFYTRDGARWAREVRPGDGAPPRRIHEIDAPPPALPRRKWHDHGEFKGDEEFHFGLPWRAMWCKETRFSVDSRSDFLRTNRQSLAALVGLTPANPAGGGFSMGMATNFMDAGYGVPLGVMPMGFALNTLFWGAVWAGVLTLVPALRRRGRRGRGECVRCRYSRAGLAERAACPECGHTPLTARGEGGRGAGDENVKGRRGLAMEPTTINATMRRRGRPGTSRRVVALVFLCLLLGAVTNVAVAWGAALKGGAFRERVRTGHTHHAIDRRTGQTWEVAFFDRPGAENLTAYAKESIRYVQTDVNGKEEWFLVGPNPENAPYRTPLRKEWIPQNLPRGEWHIWTESPGMIGSSEYHFGLPWRSMWCAEHPLFVEGYSPFVAARWDDVMAMLGFSSNPSSLTQSDRSRPRISTTLETPWNGVPLGVLPIGFTMNTLFWGAVWAGVVSGFLARRRRGRRGRGECVRCRYSRVGLAENAACPECGHAGGSAKT